MWTLYAILGHVIVRYTKLPTIVRYKVEFDKGVPSEEEYLAFNLREVLNLQELVRSTCWRMSTMYLNWESR